jgi:tRNA(Phe) wybutosine-synthesizing methylase Tyw3
VFAGSCTGRLTVAQQNALKDKVGTRIHTSQPNA